MGRHILRRHIRGYSDCICPIKRTPNLYELMSFSVSSRFHCFVKDYFYHGPLLQLLLLCHVDGVRSIHSAVYSSHKNHNVKLSSIFWEIRCLLVI